MAMDSGKQPAQRSHSQRDFGLDTKPGISACVSFRLSCLGIHPLNGESLS